MPICRKADTRAVSRGKRQPVVDRRIDRTRSALERSFNDIFLAEGYERTTPGRVAEAAQVGRSTFYEHFDGREDLLEKRLLRVLLPLGEATQSEVSLGDLEPVLDHFWDNRVIVRTLLDGRARTVTMRALTAVIEEHIRGQRPGSAVPLHLIAAQIAGGQLAVLEEWLSGRHRCSSADLAQVLAASARASVLA